LLLQEHVYQVVEQQWDDTDADKKQGDFMGLLFFLNEEVSQTSFGLLYA
jgi:hypothetical protein